MAAVAALAGACTTADTGEDPTGDGDGKGDCAGCTATAGPRPFTLVDARLTLKAQTTEANVVTFKMLHDHLHATYMQYISTHLDEDTTNTDRLAWCLDVIEAPGAILCMTYAQAHMNTALMRAGVFTGQGNGMPKGTILPARSRRLANLGKIIAGSNFTGASLIEFFAAMKATDQVLLAEERDVAALLASPKLAQRGDAFSLIALSVQTPGDSKATLVHEIQHATFNLNPAVSATVHAFWTTTVTGADRAAIREALGAIYNADNEEVMIDEFQAYLLQQGAETSLLGAFTGKYKAPLLAALKEQAGYVPPVVE